MKKFRMVKEVKTVDESVLEMLVCNRCGKENEFLADEDIVVKNRKKAEMSQFRLAFGYGNKHEGQNWEFELCDQCLEDIVKTFKILPEGYGREIAEYDFPVIPFEQLEEPELNENEENQNT